MPSPNIGVNLRVTGHCTQGGRKYMEDMFSVAYQESNDEKNLEYAFFGVYDGHGGAEAATYAREHLMTAIVNQKLFWSDCDEDVLKSIREGYIQTHYAMWKIQDKWPKTSTGLPSTAGTTASVAFIRRGKLYIGHVGDSGIVLGYQEEGEQTWRAQPLTEDHKPESIAEKARIVSSGGKVIVKSGVPRVVWNRPRIGHKGPVRRSTPIDEIPFLAVARSLGDLWSYNSQMNEFVVSPEPDVRVIPIDSSKFRCLVFGTDGLWNVLQARTAVEVVRSAEELNQRNIYSGSTKEWTNPSKGLVDTALKRWNTTRMRADNISVVTIMLYPPGPPKKCLMKQCPTTLNYTRYTEQAEDTNITMFDHSTKEAIDLQDMPFPSNGLAIMTRYENYEQERINYEAEQPPIPSTSTSTTEQIYPSFAESYNSLLNSTYENSLYNPQEPQPQPPEVVEPIVINAASDESYSLTKLETRSEQMSSAADRMRLKGNYTTEHCYYAYEYGYKQFNNISSSFTAPETLKTIVEPFVEPIEEISLKLDETIQIHEISSSSFENQKVDEPEVVCSAKSVPKLKKVAEPSIPRVTRSKDIQPSRIVNKSRCRILKIEKSDKVLKLNTNLMKSKKKSVLPLSVQNENLKNLNLRSNGVKKSEIVLSKRTLRTKNHIIPTTKPNFKTKIVEEVTDSTSAQPPKRSNRILKIMTKSTSMSKRLTTKKHVWCPGKSAMKTRNRVQKRFSH